MRKLQNLLLLIRCFVSALFAGRATHVPQEPKKIGIIQLAKLGDMVCTTPMFAAVKKQYPNAQLFVVGDTVNKQLLDGHPHVDGYIVWNKNLKILHKALAQEEFDFICLTAPSVDALAASYLAGVPCIVVPLLIGGFSPYQTRSYTLLSRLAITKPHRVPHYAAREYLRLLEPIGIHTEDTKKLLTYSPEAKEKTLEFVQAARATGKLVIGIAPAAGNKIKQWPAERFAAVADYVIEKQQAGIMVFGGPKDGVEVQTMLQASHHTDGLLAPTLSIDELKAAVAQLDLFISGDTGPIYIAEAFGVPTIDILGPVDERDQPPTGDRHVVMIPERVAPALWVMNARVYDPAEARRQAEATSVETVTQAVDALLARIAKER